MPLRDHFRPPLDNKSSWEELHGGWPALIVQHLRDKLPKGYTAGPRVHHGAHEEDDVAENKRDDFPVTNRFDEYEVRFYDVKRG